MHRAVRPCGFITGELIDAAPDGLLLWRLRFGGSVLDAYLTEVGSWGFAYRLFLNGRFTYRERFETVEQARLAAANVLVRRTGDGWCEETCARRSADARDERPQADDLDGSSHSVVILRLGIASRDLTALGGPAA
jgi:hypothetical protein